MHRGLLLITAAWLLHAACAGIQEINTEHVPKQQQIQDEIMRAMKDSGVIDEMKDKLDTMLYENNEVDTEPEQKSFLNRQEEKMIEAFVEEYNEEKNMNVNLDQVLGIVRRVVKAPSPSLPKIFVQLTPLLDVLSALGGRTKHLTELIDRQAPVFESPAKMKDILHTLTENLKSELVRISLDEKKTKKPPTAKRPEKKSNKPKGGMDMNDYLTLGSTLLAGGNGAQLLNMMAGGNTDMSSILTMLPSLLENKNSQELLKKMAFNYLDGTPYGPMVKNVINGFLDNSSPNGGMDQIYKYADVFIKSESGKRLLKVLPKMTQATDIESFLELVHEEAEWNWGQVFDNFENSDYKEKILEQTAAFIVSYYEYFEKPPKSLAKVPALINGFLLSNGMPTYDSKNPQTSIIAIINKGVRLFSTIKGFDSAPYVKAITNMFAKAMSRHSKGNKWSELKNIERSNLLARVLDTELVEPMQNVWSVYTHSVNNLVCAQHLLCQVNANEKKNNDESRIAVVKASSLAASWALAHVKDHKGEKYWNMYKQAVWHGAKGEDCQTTYKVPESTCNIFAWQKTNFMSTSYDHMEL